MTHPTDQDRLQLIVSNAASGKLEEAVTVVSAILDKATAIEAWRVIARTKANMQRFGEAREALDSALIIDPGSRTLRFERAILLEQEGRTKRWPNSMPSRAWRGIHRSC